MSITNLISTEFTDDELRRIDEALTQLEDVFRGKVVQLTPAESQRYGKLGNKTENWVNMLHADCIASPNLVPTGLVDTAEWAKDENLRSQLSQRVTRLENLAQQLTDTNRVVGFDIYNTCSTVYKNVKFLATQNAPGAKTYYEKWSAQFDTKTNKPKPTTPF